MIEPCTASIQAVSVSSHHLFRGPPAALSKYRP